MDSGSSFVCKRPKPGEFEEEILAQEREFLENKGVQRTRYLPPPVKLVKSSPLDKVFQEDLVCNADADDMDVGIGNDHETDSVSDSTKPSNSKDVLPEIEHPTGDVLYDIKEKEFDFSKLKDFTGNRKLPKIVPSGPVLRERKLGTKKAGKSLFARTFDSIHGSQMSRTSQSQESPASKHTTHKEEVGDKIHPLLAGMTEEEILEAQKEILLKLDPQMVEFIKSRGKSKAQEAQTVSEQPQHPNKMDVDSVETKFDVSDLPINPQEVSIFPGMKIIEPDKLAWAGMIKSTPQSSACVEQNISQAQCSREKVEGKNTRFDFNGDAIIDGVNAESSTYNSGLHCHGEEMERAGYSLEELLILIRSSNAGQRSLAMDTIGNIFKKAHTGLYDGCFENSLFEVINDLDFMHAVRVALDHTNATSVNSAFQCLSDIIFPSYEEVCLDVAYLWPDAGPHPWLLTNSRDINTVGKDDKDSEVLQADLLQFLIQRSNLLLRIGFFFTEKSNIINESGIDGILKILVRIARHSPNELTQSSDILNYLVKNHVSANWNLVGKRPPSLRGVPLPLAFKVIRILADSSARNAATLYSKYEIFPALMSYLAYFEWKDQNHVIDSEDLILECFKVWTAFLNHGLAINEYTSFFPILIQFLQYYEAASEFSSFDIGHAGHLFSLLRSVLDVSDKAGINMEDIHSHWPLVKSGAAFIINFVRKILAIISAQENVTLNNDLCLFSVAQGLSFLISASQYGELNVESLNQSIELYLKSHCYESNTKLLRKHSILLNSREIENNRYPANIATTGAFLFRGKLNPMISSGSPYHFLTILIKYVKTTKTLSTDLMINDNIKKYLKQLCRQTESSVDCNFFVRFEIAFVDEILNVHSIEKEIFPIAYKMLSELPVCCVTKYASLLKKILLSLVENEEFASSLFRIYAKSLEQHSQPSSKGESKKKVTFEDSSVSKNEEIDTTILFAQWTSKLTKKYWIFEPLDEMYRNATQTSGYVENNLNLIEKQSRVFLQFILQCLENFKEALIADAQDLVMIYSRICQIFVLGDPRVYIDEVNTPILRALLKALISSPVMISNSSVPVFSNFKPTAEFSTSFYDIYADLVREFQDNSYFNELFASFLLLPLRTAEDTRLKKIFWGSEYIHCIRLRFENIELPLSWFTSQVETDPGIINLYWQLYKSAKITNVRNPMLFEIIKFHLLSQNDKMGELFREDFSKLKL